MTKENDAPPGSQRRLPSRWAIIMAAGIAAFVCCYAEGMALALTASVAVVAALHSVLE